MDLMIMNTPPSLSIMFQKPNARIALKYSCHHIDFKMNVAQIYIMKHITMYNIDAFITDLESPDS